MNIRVLGAHNRETSTARCISLLIDESLALDAGAIASGLSTSEQKNLKGILLTHQHYDHIKDIPMLAITLYNYGLSINVYTTPGVQQAIETHLFNGTVYPKYQELPEEKPTIIFQPIAPYVSKKLDRYEVLAIPVNHYNGTIGYQVKNGGKTMFYTADTGPGLISCWRHLSPRLLIADVTVPNRYEEFAISSGHLTPRLLSEELNRFQMLKGYLPQVVIVHMDPEMEQEIRDEIAVVAQTLNTSIDMAHEGTQLEV